MSSLTTCEPYRIGEPVQLLVMTPRGSHVVDAVVTSASPHDGGWTITAELSTARAEFALVPSVIAPLDAGCDGCGAAAHEPCRWGCLSHVT